MKLPSLIAGLLIAPDALAWGLQTHVFVAQWLLAALPLADSQLRAAVLRWPRLVLAGACLPDLALAGRMLGLAVFHPAHRWATLHRLAAACWDEERAIAVGYASHLLADVIAHHRFVPEHERRIAGVPHATHALCEWAMDRHIEAHLEWQPAQLLAEEAVLLGEAAARTFRCPPTVARRALAVLARGEHSLRASGVPALCRRAVVLYGTDFDAYLRDVRTLVGQVEGVLAGLEPSWQPEPDQAIANDAPAINAPSRAPAMTSLG